MKSTIQITVLLVGWICKLAIAQEKVCSSFCSSLGMMQSNPGKSCEDIYKINRASRGISGNYWINTPTGAQQVYCDMELECGGHNGGWIRIADLDTSRGDNCPSGWIDMTIEQLKVCRAASNDSGCHPLLYSTHQLNYSRVCGMAKGYQKGTPDAFVAFRLFRKRTTISQAYVDGLSIIINNTTPKHIWSFAAGLSNNRANCPCSVILRERDNSTNVAGPEPQQFVKNNYYCDSGHHQLTIEHDTYFLADPLWDGEDCSGTNQCCNEPGMPWFLRQFPTAVSGDIAARICRDQPFADEETLIEQLQLYVQ